MVYDNSEGGESTQNQLSVLSVDMYLEVEKARKAVKELERSQQIGAAMGDSQLDLLLTEWENIHNKVIFDAINEALDGFRPYGLKGPPLPWSTQTRPLTYKHG